MNKMKEIRIEKVTLNIGSGKEQNVLEKGMTLIKHITGIEPVKTITQKRIAQWGIRPGIPVGCKLTLRKDQKESIIKRFVAAKDNILAKSNFDEFGNISFGVSEYIDLGETEYHPDVGIMGLQISITLERPGFRIKKRKIQKRKIPKTHKISREESIKFMKDAFSIQIKEELDEEDE